MALRTLCSRMDWPLKRLSAGAFWETTATRSCTTLSRDRPGHLHRTGCRPAGCVEIVGTSSPVVLVPEHDGTRSTLMISNVMSTMVRSSRSRSNSAESFCETSSSI